MKLHVHRKFRKSDEKLARTILAEWHCAINHSSFGRKNMRREEKEREGGEGEWLACCKNSNVKTYLAGVRLDWLFVRETAANRPRRQPAVFCSDITATGNELREIIPPTSILIYKRSISLIACTILRTSFVMWEDRCRD